MENQPAKCYWAGKPWLKITTITIGILIVSCVILWINAAFGNPIKKQIAKSFCLDYFEEKYAEEFIILDISYWSKLPGYVLILGLRNDPQIQFTCNPNCETLCYSDEYGGVLASNLLVDHIQKILQPGFGDLTLHITAKEDPYTEYAGEKPDYFERDPFIRLNKNHQVLRLSWIDPNLREDEFLQISKEIADYIKIELPLINPNLLITMSLFPDETSLAPRYETDYLLFQTIEID